MQTAVLATDGGPHPVELWAEATASHIIQIGEHVSGDKLVGARKLELAIIEILEGHHSTVQEGERARLSAEGVARCAGMPEPADHLSVDDAVAEICAAAIDTPFQEHFDKEETAEHIRVLLAQHFRTSMDIERQWHQLREAN